MSSKMCPTKFEHEKENMDQEYLHLYIHLSHSFEILKQFVNEAISRQSHSDFQFDLSLIKADIEHMIEKQESFITQLSLKNDVKNEVERDAKKNESYCDASSNEKLITVLETVKYVPLQIRTIFYSEDDNAEDLLKTFVEFDDQQVLAINNQNEKKQRFLNYQKELENKKKQTLFELVQLMENKTDSLNLKDFAELFEAENEFIKAKKELVEANHKSESREKKLETYLDMMDKKTIITNSLFDDLLSDFTNYLDDRYFTDLQDALELKIDIVVAKTMQVWDKINTVCYVASFIDGKKGREFEKEALALIVADENTVEELVQKQIDSLNTKVHQYINSINVSSFSRFKKAKAFIIQRIGEIQKMKNGDSDLMRHYKFVQSDIHQLILFYLRCQTLVSIDKNLTQRRRDLEAEDFFNDIHI